MYFRATRQFLMQLLGAKSGCAITVGSHVHANGEQSVAVTLTEGWKRSCACMTPAGARRIASQMNEWADAAEKHNEEHNSAAKQWSFVVKAAIADKVGDDQPVSQAT